MPRLNLKPVDEKTRRQWNEWLDAGNLQTNVDLCADCAIFHRETAGGYDHIRHYVVFTEPPGLYVLDGDAEHPDYEGEGYTCAACDVDLSEEDN